MIDSKVTFVTESIGEAIIEAASKASWQVAIVSPFITKVALDKLLAPIDPSVRISIVTRWRVRDVAAGISQPSILDSLVPFTDSRVVLQQDLHSKLYAIDDEIAYVGSANVTEAGLGFASAPNLETEIAVSPIPTSILTYVRGLETSGVPGTPELRSEVEKAANCIEIQDDQSMEEVVPSKPPISNGFDLATFPSMRHPEELYERYRAIQSCSSNDEREAVLNDLICVDLPYGLSNEEFMTIISKKLLDDEILMDFDEYLAEPRRFGEMTQWLKNQCPHIADDHSFVQRRLQTILRWLQYFIPERYKLDQPNYSEVFYRVD